MSKEMREESYEIIFSGLQKLDDVSLARVTGLIEGMLIKTA